MDRKQLVSSICFSLFFIAPFSIKAQVRRVAHPQITQSGLPIMFEPAAPQRQGETAMIGRMANGIVEFRPSAIAIYSARRENSVFRIDFDGARNAVPKGVDLEPSQTNYLLGKDPAHWRTHVSNYAKVVYSSLYPGIDAIFYGNNEHLEHDFVVKPGADYRQIHMRFPGNSRIHLDKNGTLIVTIAGDSLRMDVPSIYQSENGRKEHRNGAFRVLPSGDVGFMVKNYDPHFNLIIDPTLVFSTYLSPFGTQGVAIATDASGNNYVTGTGQVEYPVSTGAFSSCASCNTNNAVTFISKLSADGSKLIYSTILGGNNFAQPTGIAVDTNGNTIVSGWTAATDFPTKSGQPILQQSNNYVGFLISLSPDGASLNYGTLLGPSPTATLGAMTYANAVAVDSAGNAYVTGVTGRDFFVSSGALNQVATGTSTTLSNVYLVKFDPAGTLLYSAILGTADPQNGGAGFIGSSAIAVDSVGNVYVTGEAGILWPITSNSYLKQIAGPRPYADPFVMKVAPDAKSMIYSTYLDPAGISGIAVLADGNVFVTGNGAGASYPTTPNAYEHDGKSNSFLTELNAEGSALVYSTLVCGTECNISAIALDPDGNIWLAAQNQNPAFNFPFQLMAPLQATLAADDQNDEVSATSALMEFDPTGQILKFSTFLGGIAPGFASSVAIDPNGRVHVSGLALPGMYTTPGAYASAGAGFSGSGYAYVAVVDPTVSNASLCVVQNTGLTFSPTGLGFTDQLPLTIRSCGEDPLVITGASTASSNFSVPSSGNGCIGILPVGQSCTLLVQFSPTAATGTQLGVLTIDSNAPIPAELLLTGFETGAEGGPILSLSPSSFTFGTQPPGTQSAPETITVSNTGNAPLNGLNFVLPTSYQQIFPFSSTCGSSLNPGSCTFTVAFKPASGGTTATTLTIQNSSGLPFQQVNLTGTSPQSPFWIGTQTGSIASTVTAGNTAIYALKMNPAAGYSGTVNLACSNLPANASCTFTPSTIVVSGGTVANFTLSISTESTQAASLLRMAPLGMALAGFVFLLPLKRKRSSSTALICFCTLLIMSFSGCGGSSSGASTGTSTSQTAKVTPGTYTINVVASDTSTNQVMQAITLIVQ